MCCHYNSLLESSGELIHLLEKKEYLAAENELLKENISRITRCRNIYNNSCLFNKLPLILVQTTTAVIHL